VARVLVRYGDPLVQEYNDLWVVRFAVDGRAHRFEEWPFWPTHGRAPVRTEPVVLGRDDVPSGRYVEWVRSQSLSAGVYRIAAGGVDDQAPHREDEVYVVTAGAARLEVEGRRTPVGPAPLPSSHAGRTTGSSTSRRTSRSASCSRRRSPTARRWRD
jgi:mannose-6-phosphate isomerase-like protein (cupin superfamily)